jgi:hypothetical protein
MISRDGLILPKHHVGVNVERAVRRMGSLLPSPALWMRAMQENISAAITAAKTGAQLDAIARDITAAWGKGTLADDTFTALYGQVHRRRQDLKGRAPGQPDLPLPAGQGVAPRRADPSSRRAARRRHQTVADPSNVDGGSPRPGRSRRAWP